jgi:Concanavalin A-like lectin/glucanases superfamily
MVAWAINIAQQPLSRFLVRVLILAMIMALIPKYLQADVRDGLIAEYRFDEWTGRTATDYSGHHLHGRLEGHPRWVKGYYGNGLQFDGAADYVYVGNQDALDVTQYTLTAWVRTDGRTKDPERQEILEKAGAYWLNIRSDSHLLRAGGFFGGCQGHEYWTYLDTATAVPLHTWTHMASTYNGAALTIFLDGVLSVTKAEVRSPCTTNRRLLIIGAKKLEDHAPAEAFFSGILDEVRIYSRALSSAEIQEVMQASRE